MEKSSGFCFYLICSIEDSFLNNHTYISAMLMFKLQKAFLGLDSSVCHTSLLNRKKKVYDVHLCEGNTKIKHRSEIHINLC